MVRKLILEKLAERGLSMKDGSIRIGKSHSYLQQFLKRGIPVELGEHERAKLAPILGVSEAELRGSSSILPSKEYVNSKSPDVVSSPRNSVMSDSRHNLVDTASPIPPLSFGDRDLPVFGTAQGGRGGALIMTNEAVDWVVRPAPLLRVKDGYGMIVTGDSMSPKLENGSTALVNPHLPPRNGDTCIFRSHQDDGSVYAIAKKLERFNDETWFVSQYTPKKSFKLKRSEWQVCHVVVGDYFP